MDDRDVSAKAVLTITTMSTVGMDNIYRTDKL